jgi:hypothetical protein
VVWLNQKVHPIFSEAICLVLLHDVPFAIVQHVNGRSRMCVHCAWKISSHIYFVPALFSTKKQKQNKQKQARALPAWTPRSLLLITTIIYLFIYFYSIYFIIIFFICSPNFILKHNSSKAKIKFYGVYLALVRLHQKLLPLFMTVTQNSLTKIQHHVKFWLKKAILN